MATCKAEDIIGGRATRGNGRGSSEVTSEVGHLAGEVWNYLNSNGGASLARVSEATGASRTEVSRAVGWLAREGKVEIHRSSRGDSFRLSPES